jgi:HPt (histidine-containing phosphotransfer) domain-containing protein
LLEDAELRDVVEEFVGSLTERVTELKDAYRQTDWTQMQTLAHRLKGAGGSYGYPDISQLAASMEQDFRVRTNEHFAQQIQELEALIVAARAGLTTT